MPEQAMQSPCVRIPRRERAVLWGCVAFLALLGLPGCNDSYTPDVSTETGNPPALDSSAIALVVTADSVHVRGEPGAVMPPQGEIEVTNISNDAVATGPVQSDGSFDVEVNGSVNDAFEVRVVWNGERSEAVYVIRGGAAIGEGDGGTLSCEQRQSLAVDFLAAAAQDADDSCEVDADCQIYVSAAPCLQTCDAYALSQTGLDELAMWEADFVDGICVEDGESICPFPAAGCALLSTPSCVGGACTVMSQAVDCWGCVEADIAWRITSPGTLPALPSNESFSITGCNDFNVMVPGRETCSWPVTQCSSSTRGGSIEGLLAALAHPEVVSAFEAGGEIGEPEETSGFVYEITVGGSTVTYRSCANQAGTGCMDLAGIKNLLGWLELISIEYTVAARSECGGGTACAPQVVQMIGTCEPAPRYYWDGLRCVGLTGCSCAGPDCDNGYASEAECEDARAGCADAATVCGGIVGGRCEEDQFCAYVPSQGCSVLDAPASCQPMPAACDLNLDPVCGCDNQTYGNYCEASLAGMGIIAVGECGP